MTRQRAIPTAIALAMALPALAGCATVAAHSHHAYAGPEATPYDPDIDAKQAVADALQRAQENGHVVLAIFGANWCHDSRALAGHLQSPALAPLVATHFEVVYLDAGVPQTGEGRNLDIAEKLGVSDIEGTPTMLAVGPGRTLLNTPADARGWRNASTRSEADIRQWLEAMVSAAQ